MSEQNKTRIWQWITLGFVIWVAVATVYMIAVVGGAL